MAINQNDVEKIAAGIKWIIFPENKWIKCWDALILLFLFINLFMIPFQIGVSFGYFLFQSTASLGFDVFMNTCFFIDNFVYFFRAYRCKWGYMILSLKTIRRQYLSTYFVPNLLGTLPTTLIVYRYGKSNSEQNQLSPIIFLQLVKVFLFVRIPCMRQFSLVGHAMMKKYNSQMLALVRYTVQIILLAHVFACLWSFIAFIEAGGTFSEPNLLVKPNWIANWYNNTRGEGSLNPIGDSQALSRYALSLFWSVQTIISVGYGNIVPYTESEFWMASIMMLVSGIFWAYIIGGLVEVAGGLYKKEFLKRTRLDKAREMIGDFETDDAYKELRSKILRFIHAQQIRSQMESSIGNLYQAYPVLESLTPELQRISSFLLIRKYLETVPYLSSKFLTVEEQSELALRCAFVEFAAGEKVTPRSGINHLGVGILVMRSGIAMQSRHGSQRFSTNFFHSGKPFGLCEVLLEDELSQGAERTLYFMTFSKVVFIPRTAILTTLKLNKKAWKDCARWRYLASLMLAHKANNDRAQLDFPLV